jgi:hypothetical protein
MENFRISSKTDARTPVSLRFCRKMLLWVVFFLICLGLGYPTLNRYDPRNAGGLRDSQVYYQSVLRTPEPGSSHMEFRVLVPWLARPVHHIAEGHIGTWDAVSLGLLVVNAFFVATTAYLLVAIGGLLVWNDSVALLAASLYLLNFDTSNLRLSGLIDSAEGCFLLAISWSLLCRRLWLLPLWGLLGALAKESFVPFSMIFTVTWWFVSGRRQRWKPLETLTILSTGAVAVLSVTMLHMAISGRMVWPWEFAASLRAHAGHLESLRANILDRNLIYAFVWLLPLGILRLNRFPSPWTVACAGTALLDFMLVTWHGAAPGTASRALFSIAGPLLSLSAAAYLTRMPVTDKASLHPREAPAPSGHPPCSLPPAS